MTSPTQSFKYRITNFPYLYRLKELDEEYSDGEITEKVVYVHANELMRNDNIFPSLEEANLLHVHYLLANEIIEPVKHWPCQSSLFFQGMPLANVLLIWRLLLIKSLFLREILILKFRDTLRKSWPFYNRH